MPQVIEPDVRQFGSFQDGLEVLVDQAIHIHWPFKLRDEDEIYGFTPLFGINNRVLCLALFQVFQLRKNPIFHPDDSPASSHYSRLKFLSAPHGHFC